MAELGAAMREARRAAGLTLRDVADRVGLDFTYLSKVENDRQHVSAESTRLIGEVLGWDPEPYLLRRAIERVPAEVRAAIEAAELDRIGAWVRLHGGCRLRYVEAEYEPAGLVCDDCEDDNDTRLLERTS